MTATGPRIAHGYASDSAAEALDTTSTYPPLQLNTPARATAPRPAPCPPHWVPHPHPHRALTLWAIGDPSNDLDTDARTGRVVTPLYLRHSDANRAARLTPNTTRVLRLTPNTASRRLRTATTITALLGAAAAGYLAGHRTTTRRD